MGIPVLISLVFCSRPINILITKKANFSNKTKYIILEAIDATAWPRHEILLGNGKALFEGEEKE